MQSQHLGCNSCDKGGHLPPRVKKCKDSMEMTFECEPEEKPVDCMTEEMVFARRCYVFTWILLVGIGGALGQAFIKNNLELPSGPKSWFWGGVVVMVLWGFIAVHVAIRTVTRSPDVFFIMYMRNNISFSLLWWLVAVVLWLLEYKTWCVVCLGIALVFSWAHFRELFKRGHQKPSVMTYVIFLGYIAFLSGFTTITFVILLVDLGVPFYWAFIPLIKSVWLSLELGSHFFAAPIVVGTIAFALNTPSGPTQTWLIIFAIVTGILFLRGLWYRVLSRHPRDGRNFFVFIQYRKKSSKVSV